jgi:hypothetical protein
MAKPSTRAKWRALRSARSSTLKKCLTAPALSEMAICNLQLKEMIQRFSIANYKLQMASRVSTET